MSELLSYGETQKLLDELGDRHQKLVADVIPAQITVGALQRVLQNLLAERISIRDLPTILEGVAEAAGYSRNVSTITEHVRARLARQITETPADDPGVIPLVSLSPDWEQAFAAALTGTGDTRQMSRAQRRRQQLIPTLRHLFHKTTPTSTQ